MRQEVVWLDRGRGEVEVTSHDVGEAQVEMALPMKGSR